MNFREHSELAGRHAFLSPSSYHWRNYTNQKLQARYVSHRAARRGTELHQLANDLIRLGVPLPDTDETLNMYVNDAILFGLNPEVHLFYSHNCFGQSDAVGFDGQLLRIHDYKSGVTKANFMQLELYSALFCLEYVISPFDIGIELRIYQSDEVLIHLPTQEAIAEHMEVIVDFDQQIEAMKGEL